MKEKIKKKEKHRNVEVINEFQKEANTTHKTNLSL